MNFDGPSETACPPHPLVVGFTGHRHLQRPQDVATALARELAALQKKAGVIISVSSVAIGSDMLFAEEALRLGIPWSVLLPMPAKLFRDDFTLNDWAHAEALMPRAWKVTALEGTQRPQVYVDVGRATVDQADILLAVWDGKPAEGPGGTAEIVTYAQKEGRPIIILREAASEVERVVLNNEAFEARTGITL